MPGQGGWRVPENILRGQWRRLLSEHILDPSYDRASAEKVGSAVLEGINQALDITTTDKDGAVPAAPTQHVHKEVLRRILCAFAAQDPHVGFQPSLVRLCYLAHRILHDEKAAFQLVCTLCQRLSLADYFVGNTGHLQADVVKVIQDLEMVFPAIVAKVREKHAYINLESLVESWLRTLLADGFSNAPDSHAMYFQLLRRLLVPHTSKKDPRQLLRRLVVCVISRNLASFESASDRDELLSLLARLRASVRVDATLLELVDAATDPCWYGLVFGTVMLPPSLCLGWSLGRLMLGDVTAVLDAALFAAGSFAAGNAAGWHAAREGTLHTLERGEAEAAEREAGSQDIIAEEHEAPAADAAADMSMLDFQEIEFDASFNEQVDRCQLYQQHAQQQKLLQAPRLQKPEHKMYMFHVRQMQQQQVVEQSEQHQQHLQQRVQQQHQPRHWLHRPPLQPEPQKHQMLERLLVQQQFAQNQKRQASVLHQLMVCGGDDCHGASSSGDPWQAPQIAMCHQTEQWRQQQLLQYAAAGQLALPDGGAANTNFYPHSSPDLDAHKGQVGAAASLEGPLRAEAGQSQWPGPWACFYVQPEAGRSGRPGRATSGGGPAAEAGSIYFQ